MWVRDFSIIMAIDKKNGLWKDGGLPWDLKTDLKYFQDVTTESWEAWKQNAVIMGRVTWDSIPNKFRPLKNRHNIIISRKKKLVHENVSTMLWLEQALSFAGTREDIDKIFIIWWANIYSQAIHHDKLTSIYLTRIKEDFWCDTHFLWIPDYFKLTRTSKTQIENWIEFYYEIYERS